jgi:hypothetical protein
MHTLYLIGLFVITWFLGATWLALHVGQIIHEHQNKTQREVRS